MLPTIFLLSASVIAISKSIMKLSPSPPHTTLVSQPHIHTQISQLPTQLPLNSTHVLSPPSTTNILFCSVPTHKQHFFFFIASPHVEFLLWKKKKITCLTITHLHIIVFYLLWSGEPLSPLLTLLQREDNGQQTSAQRSGAGPAIDESLK